LDRFHLPARQIPDGHRNFHRAGSLRGIQRGPPAGIPTPVESGELDQQLVEPLPGIIVRGMRIFGGIALFIGISLILLIVWAEVSGYR
jgi:hypothetical protein